jgi:hypothetical protein
MEIAQGKMRINSRKIWKNLRRIWTAPKRIFETFCTQEAPRCIGMNATHKTIYLISEKQPRFSLYYIPCKENKCWKIFKKMMRKFLFNYSFYSRPEIGNFRV